MPHRRYADIYKDRDGPTADAYALLEPIKDRLFPRTFEYKHRSDDGAEEVLEQPLFGDLAAARAAPTARPQISPKFRRASNFAEVSPRCSGTCLRPKGRRTRRGAFETRARSRPSDVSATFEAGGRSNL